MRFIPKHARSYELSNAFRCSIPTLREIFYREKQAACEERRIVFRQRQSFRPIDVYEGRAERPLTPYVV